MPTAEGSVRHVRLLGAAPMNQHSSGCAGWEKSTITRCRTFEWVMMRACANSLCKVLGVLSGEGLVSLERVMHDGTRIKAFAGADSFRREERLKEHLEAARKQVEAMGDPREEEPTRKRAARERALRERQQRLEQALEEVQKVREAKRQDKEQARASQSDPQSRVMKQSDGGYAPSYNVQLSTEASHRIIVGAEVSQSPNDCVHLIGAVEKVEANLGKKPAQVVVDGGF